MPLPSLSAGGKIEIGNSDERSDDLRFECAARRYLTFLKAAGRSRLTIASYSKELYRLADILGNVPLRAISAKDLRHVVAQLAAADVDGVILRPATMNRVKSVFRSFFSWCFDSELVTVDPSAGLKSVKVVSRKTIPITKSEIALFLKTIRNSEDSLAGRDEALFAVYAYTGIRRTEALRLRIGDYDPKGAVLNLEKAKGGESRTLYVPRPLAKILGRYKKSFSSVSTLSPFFPGRNPGLPLTPRQVQLRFDHWKSRSGVNSGLTIHSFRAGYATLLHKTTKDPLLVSKAMGHKDIRSTNRYVHMTSAEIRQAVEKTFT
jgi:integrase/recombinase XerC